MREGQPGHGLGRQAAVPGGGGRAGGGLGGPPGPGRRGAAGPLRQDEGERRPGALPRPGGDHAGVRGAVHPRGAGRGRWRGRRAGGAGGAGRGEGGAGAAVHVVRRPRGDDRGRPRPVHDGLLGGAAEPPDRGGDEVQHVHAGDRGALRGAPHRGGQVRGAVPLPRDPAAHGRREHQGPEVPPPRAAAAADGGAVGPRGPAGAAAGRAHRLHVRLHRQGHRHGAAHHGEVVPQDHVRRRLLPARVRLPRAAGGAPPWRLSAPPARGRPAAAAPISTVPPGATSVMKEAGD
mmetsp:Transcript_114236/g.323546  ORF Transcript_114236/g.323546 Transcript_114236/m.323546 type:complete len:290 (-) Transcript_114236:15-884(-)